MALTNRFVETVSKPGRYSDDKGLGLILVVRSRTSKSWVQQLQKNGKRTARGLGSFRNVSLAQARAIAFQNQDTLRTGNGTGPKAVPNFEECAELFIAETERSWKGGSKVSKSWRATFETYIYPHIGNLPVNEITTAQIKKVLLPLWHEKLATGKKLRKRIYAVMQWAVGEDYRESNPVARGTLKMPNSLIIEKPMPSAPYSEIRGVLDTVNATGAYEGTKLILEFIALTGCRTIMAREMLWSEVNLKTKTWTVPAHKMKRRDCGDFNVPLTKRCIQILKQARKLGKDDLVFPASRGGQQSDNTLSKLLRENGYWQKHTPHGFRTSYRTWVAENVKTNYVIAELCIAHETRTKVQRAYDRTDYLEERREIATQWDKYLNG